MTTDSAPLPTGPDDTVEQAFSRDFLVLSEEQLRVQTDRELAGYARLEKFTVTETETITVEVTREEVRLVQRASGGAEIGRPAAAGSADSDNGRWMTLSREEVVVTKRVVPLERVRLEVYPVTEQRQVTDEVRKEQIDSNLDSDATPARHHHPTS